MRGKDHERALNESNEYELRLKVPNINKFIRKIAENNRNIEIKAVTLINDDGTKVIL